MVIDWTSWHAPSVYGYFVNYLDRETGVFVCHDGLEPSDAPSASECEANPGRYLATRVADVEFWRDTERALLEAIEEPSIRERAIDLQNALERLVLRLSMPRDEQKRERKRLESELKDLVAHDASVMAAWNARKLWLDRETVLADLRAAGIACEPPPEWESEGVAFRALLERGRRGR